MFDRFVNLVILDNKDLNGKTFEYSASEEFDQSDLAELDKENSTSENSDDFTDND